MSRPAARACLRACMHLLESCAGGRPQLTDRRLGTDGCSDRHLPHASWRREHAAAAQQVRRCAGCRTPKWWEVAAGQAEGRAAGRRVEGGSSASPRVSARWASGGGRLLVPGIQYKWGGPAGDACGCCAGHVGSGRTGGGAARQDGSISGGRGQAGGEGRCAFPRRGGGPGPPRWPAAPGTTPHRHSARWVLWRPLGSVHRCARCWPPSGAARSVVASDSAAPRPDPAVALTHSPHPAPRPCAPPRAGWAMRRRPPTTDYRPRPTAHRPPPRGSTTHESA